MGTLIGEGVLVAANRGDCPLGGLQQRGHYDIWSRLERWEGSIDVTLDCNGDFEVRMGEKNYPRTLIAAGNVNTRQLVEPANVS